MEDFCSPLSSKGKIRENVDLLWNVAGGLVTKDVEKAEVLFSAILA